MNDYLIATLLGVVEGLTEFLPVSSTAHLRISEALLGIEMSDGYWKMFSIVIQLGAILCLPLFFWKRILSLFSTFPKGIQGDRTAMTHPLILTFVAFFCTAVPSFLLARVIGEHLESLVLMASALIVGGVVMWIVDAKWGRPAGGAFNKAPATELEGIGLGQAVWIGLCQTLSAIFPGTSRSMATIAAGEIAGLSRPVALEFSFLLSIPTMIAATGYDLLKWLKGSVLERGTGPGSIQMDSHGWVVLLIGFVISFIVALAVVAWFMHWVRKRGLAAFAVYRIVMGTSVLIWALRTVR